MTTATKPAPHHDKLTCVKHYGCLRPECLDRLHTYQRNRHHSRNAGTWQPLVDAEPVRRHLLALYAVGFTPVRISELASLPFETVIGFTRAYGPPTQRRSRKRRCKPEIAEKILAITADQAMPGRVDATGTRRRIQALVAAGWPMNALGPHFGIAARTAGCLVGQDRLYGRTAKAIADAYQQLARMKPEKNGVSAYAASRARKHAARRRWPTVAYWADRQDAIDDPHFVPDYKVTQAEVLAEEAHWLITTAGLNRTQVAERLGKHRSYIDRVLAEHPQQAAA